MRRWAPSIEPYSQWIEQQNFDAAKCWVCALRDSEASQAEAAIAEAVAWDWLAHRVHSIELAYDPARRSPDFKCTSDRGAFFVEVTNVSRPAMTEAMGLEDFETSPSLKHFRLPADRLHQDLLKKAKQGVGLDAAYLVFLTTLHGHASMRMTNRSYAATLLHSEEFLTADFDAEQGCVVGGFRSTVDFNRAAFTRSKTLNGVRAHVSGALLGPFGLYPNDVTVLGILNPEATHPFDRRALPDAPFAQFREWPPRDQVQVVWTDEPPPPIATPPRPRLWTPDSNWAP